MWFFLIYNQIYFSLSTVLNVCNAKFQYPPPSTEVKHAPFSSSNPLICPVCRPSSLSVTLATHFKGLLKNCALYFSRSHNRGRRPQARAISSIEVVPMIWDNNSIFRTNCAIACGTRAYMLRGFLRMSRGGNGVLNSEIFHVFGPELNAFTSVGIFLYYFRRELLHFE